MNLLFKTLGYLFTLLFITGAILQYNDPDALVWVIIYAIAALVSLGFALNDGDITTVELGREAFGLLIISIVMLVFSFRVKRKL